MVAIDDLAALTLAAGALVVALGVVRAVIRPRAAAASFARAVVLALEFFLAGGLLRLGEAMTSTALATVAAIIATRQVVSRGVLRPLARDAHGNQR